MVDFDKQEKRIIAILGTKKYGVTGATLKKYLKYLKKHIGFPCQLTATKRHFGCVWYRPSVACATSIFPLAF